MKTMTDNIWYHTPAAAGVVIHDLLSMCETHNKNTAKVQDESQTCAATCHLIQEPRTRIPATHRRLIYSTTHPLWRVCGNTWSLPSVTTHPMSTQMSPQYPQPPKPGVPAPTMTIDEHVCGNIRFLPSVKIHPMNEHTDEPPICATTQAAPRNYDRQTRVPHTCFGGVWSLPYVKTHLTNEHTDEPPNMRSHPKPPPKRQLTELHTTHPPKQVHSLSPQALSAHPLNTMIGEIVYHTPAAAGVWFYIMLATNEDP
ncbi:hypothetical protein BS47DRAFT_1360841 [Hydnum rufescens UP504]|uniref:Uncharacterized protein n=1 Tax=Hydnum rufescens UP504 TaxID=1448309 RepID=A0A9P6B1H5_9AGAM|nr:hypothetical protein BS47DRAFT_1360841 [Hydnum rufescens UP504]